MRSIVPLAALRLLAILVFFSILSGIVIRHRWSRPGRTVAVLVDVSRSMGFSGADSAARSALRVLLPGLDARVSFHVFAETTLTADSALRASGASAPRGDRTRLGAALSGVLGRQPGAVLLLSDGRDNGAVDPLQVAAEGGVPVYAIGCGARQADNLSLDDLYVSEDIYAGEEATADVRLSWSGGRPVSVSLSVNDRAREITFEAAGSKELSFGIVLFEPGFQLLRVVAESVPGEVSAADNIIERMVWVRHGRIPVRYLADAPGPSSRFITRSLERLPRVRLTRDVTPGSQGLGRIEGGRPDVYVLDQPGAGQDWPGWQRVQDDVRAGSGLLVLAGAEISPGHPLASFVPGGGQMRQGPVRVTARPGSPLSSGEIPYDRLPPLDWAVVPVRPDSFDPWLVDDRDGFLVAGARRLGRGRVLYVGGTIWRWGFLPGTIAGAPTPLEHVLERAVQYLAGRGDDGLRLVPIRPEVMAGDPTELELHAVAADGRPLTGAAPTVRLVSPDAGLPQPMVEQAEGRYRARLSALAPGSYEALAVVDGDTARAAFTVSARTREDAVVGLDDRLLRDIARVSGGRYYDSDDLPRTGLEIELAASRHGFEFAPRRSAWAYLLVVLLAGCEWVLRRRRGWA